MNTTLTDMNALYHVRKGEFAVVDVPELSYVMVDGVGAPEGGEFAEAVQALYAVSYGAHFLMKRERGEAPHVMALEAQWWVIDPAQQKIVETVPFGTVTMAGTDRSTWHWRAMIMQPEQISADVIDRAIEAARNRDLPALDRLSYVRWAEGTCAQVLHLGPYADEPATLRWLMRSIAGAGYRPYGRHHEIYLSDPRRTAPERLRTILRHPIQPVPD